MPCFCGLVVGCGPKHAFIGPIAGIQYQYILHFRGLLGKRVGRLVVGVFSAGMLIIGMLVGLGLLVIVVVRLVIFKLVWSVLTL